MGVYRDLFKRNTLEPVKWTERLIQQILVSSRGPVPYERYLCIPNVCGGGITYTGEADLIAITPSGYAREYEIKVSVADLKKDKTKDKHLLWHNDGNLVSELWYVIPEDVHCKVNYREHIPHYAGLIVVSKAYRGLFKCDIVRKADRKPNAVKLTDKQQLKIARLGCLRFWSYSLKKEQPYD